MPIQKIPHRHCYWQGWWHCDSY